MNKGWNLMRSSGRLWLLAALLMAVGGCAESHEATPYFVLPRQADDVSLDVFDLRYQADTSGYTFKLRDKDPNGWPRTARWAYVRKDSLVGVRAKGPDFATIWLRRDWDGPPKPVTREELEKIPALPARRPGGE